MEAPRFSRIARSHLLHVGGLDWTRINPDIFGSMIQAVADDDERGALGMHDTSVPNILKVLNPLFLDALRAPGGGRRQPPHPAQPAQAHRPHSGVRPRLRLRQLPGHRLQGAARHHDIERLEKLFDLYTNMTATKPKRGATR